MPSSVTPHPISLCKRAFAQLLAGRPYLVWKDLGQQAGDLLYVYEFDLTSKCTTGAVAVYQLTWVSRAADDNGELSGLIAPQTVILGIGPSNVLVATHGLALPVAPSPPAGARGPERTPWPPVWAPVPPPNGQRLERT